MLTLARWLARWPLWLLHAVGGLVGWGVYAVSARYRRRFDEQVRHAQVPADAAGQAIAEAGRMVMELPRLWLRPTAGAEDSATAPMSLLERPRRRRRPMAAHRPTLPASVTWTGREHVERARQLGRGVLLLTPHLGCFEITAQAYAAEFGRDGPVTVMYRPARQAWLRDVQRHARDRPGLTAVPASLAGVRQMLRALRRGEAVGLLPDQVPPEGMGEWAPFFGRPAYTMTLAARLVAQSDAVPLLIWGERLAGGSGYRVHVSPFPEAEALKAGPADAALAINRAMESLIRACPGQYLWGYDRHKAPKGMAPTPSDAAAGVSKPAEPAPGPGAPS
jgi:Kdo2-lipid IVA lauroyltransferase/acyltransferase